MNVRTYNTIKPDRALIRSHVWFVMLIIFYLSCGKTSVNYSMSTSNPDTVVITESGKGEAFQVVSGNILEIRLKSQPGTGFTWRLINVDMMKLQFIGQSIEETTQEVSGGIEYQVFQFKAIASGKLELELHYSRPFEKEKPPARVFRINVNVKNILKR